MGGLGTLINVGAIAAGGLIGLQAKRAMKENVQETVIKATGLGTLMMSLGGVISKMISLDWANQTVGTQRTMALILALVLGSAAGEMLNVEAAIERFGEWLKRKSGSAGDQGFIHAFMTASLTVCVGAMAIIGSIQDGISGDYSVLAAKAVLDFVIILMMAASMGKGCVFSAIPVGILQGSVTLLAGLLEPVVSATVLDLLSLVGNALIFCVGVNLIREKTFRVANMLPALVFAVIFAFIPGLS